MLHRLLLFYFSESTMELTDCFLEDYIQSSRNAADLKMGFFSGVVITAVTVGVYKLFQSFK